MREDTAAMMERYDVRPRNAALQLWTQQIQLTIADLVTEMTAVKHPFKAGIKAQAGVEF